jgi:hypothetical protein
MRTWSIDASPSSIWYAMRDFESGSAVSSDVFTGPWAARESNSESQEWLPKASLHFAYASLSKKFRGIEKFSFGFFVSLTSNLCL